MTRTNNGMRPYNSWTLGAWAVQCPKCEAPRGHSCRTTTGTNRATNTHLARAERAYGKGSQPATSSNDARGD